jgi:hypothetical protein
VNNMSGLDKARETADKIKAETEAEAKAKEEGMEKAKNELATIQRNPALASMYNESARLGADNLGGSLPQLKVHALGRSSSNQLADGSEPNDGYFFYAPTQEQFKEVTCHILTISRGYRAEGFQGKQNVFHQLLGGVIVNDGQVKPFTMFFTGTRLSKLWEFGKEAGKYTHAKPVSIPMFALTVKLTTESVKNDFGKSWVINFEIVKDQDGNPELILDPKFFNLLKDNVGTLEDTIASLLDAKATDKDNDSRPVQEAEPVRDPSEDAEDMEHSETIPF